MSSSILFLGTGGDAIVVGKQLRASGGILLYVNSQLLLLDPGPGALVRLKEQGINVGALDGILVSHGHLNHSHDVPAVLSAMTYGGLDRKGVIIGEESFLGRQKSRRKALADVPMIEKSPLDVGEDNFFSMAEKVLVASEGKKEDVGGVSISATPCVHSCPAVGFLITAEDATIGYTGDTEYFEGMDKHYRNADILIINCKNPSGIREHFSLNADDAVLLVQKVRPSLAVLTHFGIKMLELDPFKIAADIQKATKVQTLVAFDNMSVTPENYLVPKNQKSLDAYLKPS
ncbi:MAG: MBL fold metallo-hydrolase [Nanoarchaeota archaeon]